MTITKQGVQNLLFCLGGICESAGSVVRHAGMTPVSAEKRAVAVPLFRIRLQILYRSVQVPLLILLNYRLLLLRSIPIRIIADRAIGIRDTQTYSLVSSPVLVLSALLPFSVSVTFSFSFSGSFTFSLSFSFSFFFSGSSSSSSSGGS